MAAMAAASCARTEVPRTWLVANALAKTVSTDIDNRGVRAVASHVKDLEKALAMGKQGQPEVVGDIRYVLTDGPGAILPGAQAADRPRKIKAVPNPYPGISLALAPTTTRSAGHRTPCGCWPLGWCRTRCWAFPASMRPC